MNFNNKVIIMHIKLMVIFINAEIIEDLKITITIFNKETMNQMTDKEFNDYNRLIYNEQGSRTIENGTRD